MAQSTDELALIILAAIAGEQNRKSADLRGRRQLGVLAKQLIRRHHWQELDFLQGWGLIMSEKLAEVQQHDDGFYPMVTEAGRAFMERAQGNIYASATRQRLIEGRQLLFIIILVVMLLRVAYIVWSAVH